MTTPDSPELVINYSPTLDLRISLLRAQGHDRIARPDYCFEVECRVRHPTGSFTYSANDIYFDPNSLAAFSEELGGIQQGLRQQAALKDVGEMVVLRLEGDSRSLRATLDVREYLAPSLATLGATFEVEYDLFVNKLRAEVDRFVTDLRVLTLRT